MVEGRCAFCASYKIECSDFKTEIHKIISKLHHRQLFHNSFRDLTLLASLDLKGVFLTCQLYYFWNRRHVKKGTGKLLGELKLPHNCIMNSRQHIDYIYLKRTYSTRIHGTRPLVRACAFVAFPSSCHYVQSGYNRKINWPQQLFHRNIVNICCFNFIYMYCFS